ncbi:raffinose/stachyose/melibiose transport system permease protein [Paenibacillus sp. V4I3]|uniref:ABC transporter permease subunit n=1 Tax=Paenibacillus germinis TaxID=2654979 RepID=A0ABX1YV82_9BACL|nr:MULTISPECIES: sugar ABC transporter permease [Paenibacillus]MDQ0872385.1 raffinose/stachyose/melibiose transport system permease protein [Paenibacillus sp. V4I3]MDQ0891729.1 raffinose/stachyose/melibiose transport system permease protein [Paenibacillus sp. V4I9]MDQ0903167.1 raffinose/stachyose/melibiose transport system permease protein [Paenibacillus sp. V4I7]NOU84479.1 ABC transporter permease subunit [Paenibacillus germinis]
MNVLRVSKWTIAMFVLPCLLIYVSLVFVPILVSLYSGLLDWNGIGESTFVGLKNFQTLLFADPVFWPSVRRTLMFAVFSMAEIPVALGVAILLNRFIKKPNFLVSSYFLPVILSVVIIGQLWKTIYNPAAMGGMLNQVLDMLNLHGWTRSWLTDPKIAMYSLYFVALWQYLGYHTLIQFTGIQNIPADIYEAARIDGAEGLKADWHITFPMNIPIFKISIVLAFIGSLQAFDMVMVMTAGGPAHATDVISTHMYNMSFLSMKYGYGSAIAAFLVGMCLIATVIINAVFNRLERRFS